MAHDYSGRQSKSLKTTSSKTKPIARRKISGSSMSQLNDPGCPRLLEVRITVGPKIVTSMIDSGATHSFVYKTVLDGLNIKVWQVPPLQVILADG